VATDPVAPVWQSVQTADDPNTGGTTTSVTVTKPTSTALGDCLLAFVDWRQDPGTVTGPTGWTRIENTNNGAGPYFQAYIVVATQTQVDATNFTWSWVTARVVNAEIHRITGAAQVTGVINIDGSNTGSAADETANAVTTNANNCLIFACVCQNAGLPSPTHTPPAGWTERSDHNAGAASQAMSSATKVQAAAGSTGNATFDSTQITAVNYVGYQVAIAAPYTAPLTDSATVAEAPTESVTAALTEPNTYVESLAESTTVSLTDEVSVSLVELQTITATVSLTDTAIVAETLAATIIASLDAAVAFSETTDISVSFFLSDSLSLADSASVFAVLSLSDTATTNESLITTVVAEVAEAIAVSESPAISIVVVLTDSVSETLVAVVTATITLSEALELTEALTITAIVALDESVPFIEDFFVSNLLDLTDSVSLEEALAIYVQGVLDTAIQMGESVDIVVYTVGGGTTVRRPIYMVVDGLL
jgi:hypothetical protein